MTTPANTEHANRAQGLLLAYGAGQDRAEEIADGQSATLVSDLLADFMHFAHQQGIDFKQCVGIAEMHFDAEQAEEPER